MSNLERRIERLEDYSGEAGIACIELRFGETQAEARERYFKEHPEGQRGPVIYTYSISDLVREGGRGWMERLSAEKS